MNKLKFAAFALLAGGFLVSPAQAGCLSGAAVGGIAGHLVGHGVAGAAAGCAIGHSRSKSKQDKSDAGNQAPVQNSGNQGHRS